MTPKVESEDLIDAQRVAQLLDLAHRNTVSVYQRRYPDMPRPVVDLGSGRTKLWLRPEIERWALDRSARGIRRRRPSQSPPGSRNRRDAES